MFSSEHRDNRGGDSLASRSSSLFNFVDMREREEVREKEKVLSEGAVQLHCDHIVKLIWEETGEQNVPCLREKGSVAFDQLEPHVSSLKTSQLFCLHGLTLVRPVHVYFLALFLLPAFLLAIFIFSISLFITSDYSWVEERRTTGGQQGYGFTAALPVSLPCVLSCLALTSACLRGPKGFCPEKHHSTVAALRQCLHLGTTLHRVSGSKHDMRDYVVYYMPHCMYMCISRGVHYKDWVPFGSL